MNTSEDIEQAKYVVLTLIRKLYALSEKCDDNDRSDYNKKIKQLQKDLKFVDKSVILEKIKNVYVPYLQQLEKEE